jgi:hypothetical protein
VLLNSTNDVPGTAVNCPADSLQAAIDAAQPGDRLIIRGTCSGNFLISNEKSRLTLDGHGRGSIAGTSPFSPAVNVRGKGILIQRLYIQGGSDGIHVNRGANAVVHNNYIRNIAGSGIVVDQMSFATITSNYVRSNSESGVVVADSSTSRIGFNQDSDSVASPNRIEENGIGVAVTNGSSARLVGNSIFRNNSDGTQISRDAHGELSDNDISWNLGDAVKMFENASVQLGNDGGTTLYDRANTTRAQNSGLGIRCSLGSVADGRRGSLSGFGGASTFFATCLNSTMP